MSLIFKIMVASLVANRPTVPPPPKRGRPPKIVHDIDLSKVDEVIHDKKLDDGVRGQTGTRKAGRKRAYG
jgi:hypothetical protein